MNDKTTRKDLIILFLAVVWFSVWGWLMKAPPIRIINSIMLFTIIYLLIKILIKRLKK